MKKWILTLLLIVSSVLSFGKVPPKTSFTFMGIPVDGTVNQMRFQLGKKGFTYNRIGNFFTGEFNGKNVTVFINTNHNLVDRIYVCFPSEDRFSIRSEYNALLKQFEDNGKYLPSIVNQEIPFEENIEEEITSNGKTYEALFYYLNSERDSDLYAETLSLRRELLSIMDSEELKRINALSAQLDSLSDEDYKKHPDSATIDSFIEQVAKKTALFGAYVDYLADGNVWFAIRKDGSKYFISLYYDNLHNRPHGEDL